MGVLSIATKHAHKGMQLSMGSTIPWTGPGFWTGLDSGLDLWIMAQFSIL